MFKIHVFIASGVCNWTEYTSPPKWASNKKKPDCSTVQNMLKVRPVNRSKGPNRNYKINPSLCLPIQGSVYEKNQFYSIQAPWNGVRVFSNLHQKLFLTKAKRGSVAVPKHKRAHLCSHTAAYWTRHMHPPHTPTPDPTRPTAMTNNSTWRQRTKMSCCIWFWNQKPQESQYFDHKRVLQSLLRTDCKCSITKKKWMVDGK